jgi:5-methylcytosine-specific restriction protein A
LREITIKSGDLHRRVGGYPSHNHRMPVCCHVMRANMRSGDQILAAPPKGDGATLVIRYRLPR